MRNDVRKLAGIGWRFGKALAHDFNYFLEWLLRHRRQVEHPSQSSPLGKAEINARDIQKQLFQCLNCFGSDFFRRFERIEDSDMSGNAGGGRGIMFEAEGLN